MAEKNNKYTRRLSMDFIDSVGTYSKFLKANVDMSLHNPYGNDNLPGLMTVLGKQEDVDSLKGSYWEKTKSNSTIHATGSVSGTDGAATNQTVVAADRLEVHYSPVYNHTDLNDTVVQPQMGDMLLYPNGVIGTVLTKPDGSFLYSVAPNDPTEKIPKTIAGDEIVNLGQLTEEGSPSPEPTVLRPTDFNWGISFKKTSVENTDVASVEVVYPGDGSWTFANWKQVLEGHQQEVGAEMLVGKEVTNPVVLAVFGNAPSKNGYIPYIKSYGRTYEYDSVGGLTKADLDQYVIESANYLDTKEIGVYGSASFIINAQNLLKELSGSGASFSSFSNGKEMAVNLNHRSVALGDMTLHLKSLKEFNNNQMLGADGHNYKDTALMIPMNEAGSKTNYITVLNYGGSMGYEEKLRSGIWGNNELDESIERYTVTTRKGIKFQGQKQHAMFVPGQ